MTRTGRLKRPPPRKRRETSEFRCEILISYADLPHVLLLERYFRDKDFATASQYYSRAVDLCPRSDEHKEALVSVGGTNI
jgi:hypothetical protein